MELSGDHPWVIEAAPRIVFHGEDFDVLIVTVRPPGQPVVDHHVVRAFQPVAAELRMNDSGAVALRWARRPDGPPGWELPPPTVSSGATVRLPDHLPSNGLTDERVQVRVRVVTDTEVSEDVRWYTTAELRAEIAAGRVDDGATLFAALWVCVFGPGTPWGS